MLESLFNKVTGLKDTPTQVFSCEICGLFKNTFFNRTPPDPGDLCGLFGNGIFWSFSSLPWFSNIMLNLLTKSSFDISLLLKLKYEAISPVLWIVNKSCYNESLCLHEYTKMIGLKNLNDFYFSAESIFQESVGKQNFYACERAKKAMSPRRFAYIPPSAKSP